ncbi:hypothetical protein [Sphingobacterium bovistauri]|uniref:Uncharacterized protein n=1 Tax=Sphingobacterium bovistauri TaxID=2781959 RepID=A0ABS7Z7Q2_9SPHI|nr:hypothetical protein [Sphingobacterium bovistauri]MCA5006216.1 hypothetical protein [Sphingobacterium bovistauri]
MNLYHPTILDTIKRDTLEMDTISVVKETTPEQKHNARKSQYRTAYLWGDNKKPIAINPLGGVAISINKLYSHLSKLGKNSRRLQRVFDRELEQDKAELMWKPLTVDLTKLKGDSLFYFQMYFLPTSDFLERATYYEKVEYVTKSMRIYRDSAAVIHERMRLPKWNGN